MIIVITNRKLPDVPANVASSVPVARMGVELADRTGNEDVVRTGLLGDNGQVIEFCAKGDEQSVFGQVSDAEKAKPWIFFLHGFHQDPDENIAKAMDLQNNHGANVIAFAWPSRPSDATLSWNDQFKIVLRNALMGANAAAILQALAVAQVKSFLKDRWDNYPPAISYAQQSPVDLRAAMTLAKQGLFADGANPPMLLVHSMGNYVLQKTMEQDQPLPMSFSHIMLHQADVNSADHQWVNKLRPSLEANGRLYITTNRPDYVLAASCTRRMILRQQPTERLGQLRIGTSFQPDVRYLDFTEGPGISNEHELFRLKRTQINPYVFDCFHRIFTGQDDALPEANGQSQSGFSKMPTSIDLYRLEEIIDPVDGAFGQYDNDQLVRSLDWFDDPLAPEEEPVEWEDV